MAAIKTTPYGSWQSPITSDLIVSKTVRLGDVLLDGPDIYWVEMRPSEGGRYVMVRCTPDRQTTDPWTASASLSMLAAPLLPMSALTYRV